MIEDLRKYNFIDDHGHPLENCKEFIEIATKRDNGQVLQDLYDSEINFDISCFWDGGFTFKLGDDMNGFRATDTLLTIDTGIDWIVDQAVLHWPGSDFAKKYS